MALANHNTRIAIAASPAPRKIALIMKSKTTEALQASITVVKPDPLAITEAEAPIKPSSLGASGAPISAITIEIISASAIACTAARAAPSGFFSPVRRAMVAIAPILSPIASA